MTIESLKNYYRDKIDDIDDSALDGKSFEYKKKNSKHQKDHQQPGNPGDANQM